MRKARETEKYNRRQGRVYRASGPVSAGPRGRHGEVGGLALVCLALLSWVSLFSTNAGILGLELASALRWLGGKLAVLLPLAILLPGWLLLWERNLVRTQWLRYLYLVLLYLVLGALLQLGLPNSLQSFRGLAIVGEQGLAGGTLGGSLAVLLYLGFGRLGAYIFLGALGLASFALLTGIPLPKLLEKLGSVGKTLGQRLGLWAKNFLLDVREELAELFASFKRRGETEPAVVPEGTISLPEVTGLAEVAAGEGGHLPSEVPSFPAYPGLDLRSTPLGREREVTNAAAVRWGGGEGGPVNGENPGEARGTRIGEKNRGSVGAAGVGTAAGAQGSTQGELTLPPVFSLPPLSLLAKNKPRPKKVRINVEEQARLLEETLESFGVGATVVQINQGPVITRYELQPSPGVKVSRIVSLADDLALSLAAADIRIEAPIPGKAAIGIEVPNKEITTVYFREVLESEAFTQATDKLTIALGKDIAGAAVVAKLTDMPHLLIAGATGSGKSVCLNTVIASLLFRATPNEVRLIMVDPKRVELAAYEGIPHLLAPVVTDPKKAAAVLRWVVEEMENRYKLFASAGVRNVERFNASFPPEGGGLALPYIVVIIDELADLMLVAPTEVEEAICRLAQMARAAGIHLVIATQRPSVDVITGLIKANITSRIAFAVSSQVDSRTILDMSGAERLLGKGDMLFHPTGAPKPIRVQGAFITDKEVEDLTAFWRAQGEPDYSPEIEKLAEVSEEREEPDDPLFEEALRLVVENGQASTSFLQRRLRIGYTRAARLIDMMEARGYVGPYEGSKPRQVLAGPEVLFKPSS